MTTETTLAAHLTRRGRIAVITMDNPPVNGLGHGLRRDVVEALEQVRDDEAVDAVVLTGSARAFSGGADVREFGTPKSAEEPNLRTLISFVEASAKPVVAAISGVCLGGGLELAMGCHFRVARADASLGLPEVKLGLLPGATGTQRLPRLVGVERALDMIVGGAPVAAGKLAGTALVDEIADGDAVDAAVAFAERVVAGNRPIERVRDRAVPDAEAAEAALDRAREAAARERVPAPTRCVEAVAASLSMPFDEGVRFEREQFVDLMESPSSRGLRHAFAAERAAPKIAGIADDVTLRPVRSVGMIGAGTMGGGITMSFVNAGIAVVLLETKQDALDKGLATIRRNYETTLKKGKLTQEQLDKRMGLITPTLSYDDFRDVDLAIEAVFESLDVKRQVFTALDAACKPGAILASNTSALDLNEIAAFTKRPEDVIGLHFFSPANVMKLLEVVRGAKTADDVLATSMALARKIGKVAVVSGVCDGFIGNRILARYGAAANDLVNRGALPQQVDRALEKFGMAMGLFRVGDLAGLDIGWAGRKRRAAADPSKDYSIVADRICEAGRFGQKTGAGWYRYEAGKRDPIPDPAVEGDHPPVARGARPRRAQRHLRRGDRRALHLRHGQRGRAHRRGGHRAARVGHRRGLPQRLRLSALARRADEVRRRGRPRQRGGGARALRRRARRRPGAVDAGAAAGPAGARGPDVQLRHRRGRHPPAARKETPWA